MLEGLILILSTTMVSRVQAGVYQRRGFEGEMEVDCGGSELLD